MNHMEEVAKMLGVELGERFKCDNGQEYELTPNGIKGIFDYPIDPRYEDEKLFNNVLVALLNGEIDIAPKPWRPKDGATFWYVDKHGRVWDDYWDEDYGVDHLNYYRLGNCYRTKQEAEANRDKWVAFYASDEVLEV